MLEDDVNKEGNFTLIGNLLQIFKEYEENLTLIKIRENLEIYRA